MKEQLKSVLQQLFVVFWLKKLDDILSQVLTHLILVIDLKMYTHAYNYRIDPQLEMPRSGNLFFFLILIGCQKFAKGARLTLGTLASSIHIKAITVSY